MMDHPDIQTVTKSFLTTVDQYSDYPAIIYRQQSGSSHNVNKWTYCDLRGTIEQFARGVAARNVQTGTQILILCRNKVEYVIDTLTT